MNAPAAGFPRLTSLAHGGGCGCKLAPGVLQNILANTAKGLIPVKYLGVDKGVNVTLGLPLLRTSPDHGTAFDLAGTGRADPSSLIEAIRFARQLCA